MVFSSKVYLREAEEIKTEFFNNARCVFNTDIQQIENIGADGSDWEAVRNEINDWVYKNTNGHVKECLHPSTFCDRDEALTRMFQINVSFMRAKWGTPFPTRLVRNRDFTNIHGKKVTVPFLEAVLHLSYSEDNDHHVKYVEIPYAHNEACLCLMIPKRHHGRLRSIRETIKNFRFDTFAHIAVQKQMRKVHIILPKFKIDNTFDLKKIFWKIGFESALKEGADFSNMLKGDGGFHLTGAFHKCSFGKNLHIWTFSENFGENWKPWKCKKFLIYNSL